MIIFLFGRSGSGKSAIAQATIKILGKGEKLDVGKFLVCLGHGGYKNMKKPIFVTSTAPTKDHRGIFHASIASFKGLKAGTFSVYIHVAPVVPAMTFEIPHPDEYDLTLEADKHSVNKNAGFLANCIMARL